MEKSHCGFPYSISSLVGGGGIKIRWNRPYRPQENAVVENNNGFVTRWAEVHEKQTIEEVKAELDWLGIFQREKIKVKRCNGKTRLEKYPDLYKIQRPYSESSFDFERCKQFIEENYQWSRIISKAGQIYFCNQRIYIDKKKSTNSISIQYIAKLDSFEIRDGQNLLLKFFQIETWNAENILQFNLF